MCQIIAFGDSITFGFWDREGGWISRLRKWVDNKNLEWSGFYYRVYNLGIDGNTTDDLIARVETEISPRIEEESKTLILYAIGINDSQYYTADKTLRIPPEKFKQNIKRLISVVKKYNEIIKLECQKNKVHFIEIFGYWVKSDYKNWLEDGVHPNSVGHEKIYEKVRDFLVDNKLI